VVSVVSFENRTEHTGEPYPNMDMSRTQAGSGCDWGDVLLELRHNSRPCNEVAWNPMKQNQLAVAVEKMRGEFSVLLYDLTWQGLTTGLALTRRSHSVEEKPDRWRSAPFQTPRGSFDLSSDTQPPTPILQGAQSSPTAAAWKKHSNVNSKVQKISGIGSPVGLHAPSPSQLPPSLKFANAEAATALCWVAGHPQLLAVGTGLKYLRLYDLRLNNLSNSQTPVSVVAHNKSVLGVKSNGHSSCNTLLATFGDGPQEVVKIWDIRRISVANPVPVTQIKPPPRAGGGSSAVQQICWSPIQQYVLATTQAEANSICLWDVSKLPQRPVTTPYHVEHIPGGRVIRHFSWQEACTSQGAGKQKTGPVEEQTAQHSMSGSFQENVSLVFANRVLVAHDNPHESHIVVEDITVGKFHPLALGVNGDTFFSWGRLTFKGKAQTQNKTPRLEPQFRIASEKALETSRNGMFHAHEEIDIDCKMKWRAQDGYCMDIAQNLQILMNEIDSISPNDEAAGSLEADKLNQLWRLWSWIEKVENLVYAHRSSTGDFGELKHRRALNLVTAGVFSILGLEDGSDREEDGVEVFQHSSLHCPVFSAKGRRLALIACGWAPIDHSLSKGPGSSSSGLKHEEMSSFNPDEDVLKYHYSNIHDLQRIMQESEAMGHYERSAALAVFHGDLYSSIAALRRGAEELRVQAEHCEDESDGVASSCSHYAELMDLVAMCFAGYSNTPGKEQSAIWMQASHTLLRKLWQQKK